MTRVLRSTIAPQPAPGSIVADTDGTAWTRHLHGDVDRWYGCAPTDRGRPTMLARTWETLAASGDLTVLSEPVKVTSSRLREIPGLTHHELDVVADIADHSPHGGWDTRDVVSAYRRGIADGKTAA